MKIADGRDGVTSPALSGGGTHVMFIGIDPRDRNKYQVVLKAQAAGTHFSQLVYPVIEKCISSPIAFSYLRKNSCPFKC